MLTTRFFCCAALLLSCFCSLDPLTEEQPLVICSEPHSGPMPANASRFGIFDTRFFSNYRSSLDSLSFLLGAQPAYILWFLQIDDPFPASIVTGNAALGIKTVISMNLKRNEIAKPVDSIRNDTLLQEINAGLWDSTLAVFAQKAALASTQIYLRFGYEMNGKWFTWGKQPDDFKKAWVRAHRIFKEAGASNVKWIFAPGVLYGSMTTEQDLYSYYPGDSVVDIVGLDGYNLGDCTDPQGWRHSWRGFRSVFGKSLEAVSAFNKPLWITEVGCPTDPRRPEWLGDLLRFMDNNPCVEAFFWFNTKKNGEPDFRLESDEGSVEVMREWLRK